MAIILAYTPLDYNEKFGALSIVFKKICTNNYLKGVSKINNIIFGEIISISCGNEVHIYLKGEVDCTLTEELKKQILDALDDDKISLITIDFSQTLYFDSSVINILVGTLVKAKKSNKEFELYIPQSRFRRILEITHIIGLFHIKV